MRDDRAGVFAVAASVSLLVAVVVFLLLELGVPLQDRFGVQFGPLAAAVEPHWPMVVAAFAAVAGRLLVGMGNRVDKILGVAAVSCSIGLVATYAWVWVVTDPFWQGTAGALFMMLLLPFVPLAIAVGVRGLLLGRRDVERLRDSRGRSVS